MDCSQLSPVYFYWYKEEPYVYFKLDKIRRQVSLQSAGKYKTAIRASLGNYIEK